MHRASLVLWLALVVPAAPAADWPVPRGPSREPDPYQYDAGKLAGVPRAYLDDAPACVLYAATSHLVEADGTVEAVTHEVTRLNGRKAVEDLGEYTALLFDPSYEKLTLHLARVHKPDGRVVPVEPRHVHLRDLPTDYEVYDPSRQLVISFPRLQVGDVIEVKWSVRGKNPEYDGHFFTRYAFGGIHYPIVRDELRVRLPSARALKWACVNGDLRPAVAEDGKTRTYTWVRDNCPALPGDEDLPEEELRPEVACSTFASWEEVGTWKARRRAGCWECAGPIARTVEELTRGLEMPEERARALTHWVRRNFRYVSQGLRHHYTPHPPGEVFANRFGDCKDTSQLLAAMLRHAGLRVELASLGMRGDGQVLREVPSPWATHALLVVTLDGKEHWIDTTSSLAGWDLLPADDRDRLCYLVDAEGNLRHARTPGLKPEDNATRQETEMWVGPDGSSRSERVSVSAGLAGAWARDDFADQPEGECRRKVATDLQDSNSRARLLALSFDEEGLSDYDRPVKARMAFAIDRHFSGSDLLEGSFTDPVVWDRLLGYTVRHDREHPFVFPAPFESRHRYVVHLPPSHVLDYLPEEQAVRSKWGSFTLKVKALGEGPHVRDIELEFHTRLERVRVEPADFADFRAFREEVEGAYRVWLALRPVDDLDEAALLEAWLAHVPHDVATAAVLTRLYRDNEMETDARRVLARVRHYHPEDVGLLELASGLAATLAEREQALRELVRLAPEEPGHALELADFLVGQGKQEEARPLLQELTRHTDTSVRGRAHYQLARSHYRRDELREALAQLRAAEEADPNSVGTVRARLLEGQTYEEMGKADEAMRAYRGALELEPESTFALRALIRLALGADDRPAALRYLRLYSVAVGDDVRGLQRAAEAYRELGRLDDALELALRAREQRFHAGTQRLLGLIYLSRGEPAKAAAHLEKADADEAVVEARLRAHLLLGDVKGIQDDLDRAGRLAEGGGPLKARAEAARRLLDRRRSLLAALSFPEGKEEVGRSAVDALVCAEQAFAEGLGGPAVEALLGRAFAGGVEVGPAYSLRGRLALGRGQLTQALEDAETALRLGPPETAAYLVRGVVLLERERPGAVEALEKAAELSGRADAGALYHLARAFHRAGRHGEARKALREALDLRPGEEGWGRLLKAWQGG